MASSTPPGGTFQLAPDITVSRMGYGAMQLAGPGVFGPPRDRDAAIAVLREAVELGINHIDTSDYYGPYVTNEIIKEALHPYPDDLHLVTKIGSQRDDQGNWIPHLSPESLRQQVHDNLDRLGLDVIEIANLRVGGFAAAEPGSIADKVETMAQLQADGLIKHIGISTVNAEQIAEAQKIAPIVCVQNLYNIAQRTDDAIIDSLAQQEIAFVPYFPLGGFSPVQSESLNAIAAEIGQTPMAVALSWLLQRSPNILLIPGTSSVDHLRSNVAAADLALPTELVSRLDAIATEDRTDAIEGTEGAGH